MSKNDHFTRKASILMSLHFLKSYCCLYHHNIRIIWKKLRRGIFFSEMSTFWAHFDHAFFVFFSVQKVVRNQIKMIQVSLEKLKKVLKNNLYIFFVNLTTNEVNFSKTLIIYHFKSHKNWGGDIVFGGNFHYFYDFLCYLFFLNCIYNSYILCYPGSLKEAILRKFWSFLKVSPN